jgi:outer membrane protein OmpA-like peptidoglycan-associated protein
MTPLLLVFSAPALAAGYSTDIEIVRPTFSADTIPGVDAPWVRAAGTVRAGATVAYVRDPLVLYRAEDEVGAVVHDRLITTVGASFDLTPRFSARLTVPFGGQWGSEVPSLAGDGAAFGDVGLGARYEVFESRPVSVAVRADVFLPVGTPERYFGEGNLRGGGGVVAGARLGPVRVLADASILGRGVTATGEDFRLGSELALNGAALLDVWPETVSIGAGVVHRAGLADLWEGGAENPIELLAAGQVAPTTAWRIDLGFGRGIAPGYGTSQYRVWTGLTWVRPGKERLPRAARLVAPPPPPLAPEPDLPDDLLLPEPEPAPAWEPEELARVEADQIVIRDPIQFELGTNRILPESVPTLRAIAEQLASHPEIAHIVVEGHASDEGDFLYNYDLSITRALAVYRGLVESGVHPERMSCRGMGEVQPVVMGSDPLALAANRRVIFHIARRLRADEPNPTLSDAVRLPWTGVDAAILPLPPREVAPPPEPPPPPKKKRDDTTDPRQFEEDEP